MTNERKALNDLSNMVNEYYRRTREHGKAVNTIKQALERLEELEEENQELRERQKDILNANVELSFGNYKLKKAIEILKKCLYFKKIDENYEVLHIKAELDSLCDGYELVKEVFGE